MLGKKIIWVFSTPNPEAIPSDLIIIPYLDDNRRLVKSSNRIIDSINFGRFTIISNSKQFQEFSDYTYQGNIGDGINWAVNNMYERNKKLTSGQKYVLNNYSLKSICEIWKNLFRKIIV